MFSFKLLLVLALFAVLGLSNPMPNGVLEKRLAYHSYRCNDTVYNPLQHGMGRTQGCFYFRQGIQVGNNNYPHTFENREGFDFPVPGPYLEFPLLQHGVYFGGEPLTDRIIFDEKCRFAGVVMHPSNSNSFVECTQL